MLRAVDLGFVEKATFWQLESYQFPNKIGGKPAWLNLENLPKIDDLRCPTCQQIMIFLCQIYAPYEEDDTNFHRTLFVFICRNASCCVTNSSCNIKVFRNSLHRENRFYSFNPPGDGEDSSFNPSQWVKLCNLCGCLSQKHCGRCKEAFYCCREHQIFDWKEGHREECPKSQLPSKVRLSPQLFPEYEIVIEAEEVEAKSTTNVQEELEKFTQMEKAGNAGTLQNISEGELDECSFQHKDKTFARFRKRISNEPEQILRYQRGGQPLWIAEGPLPNVPDCEHCGGPRQFEFQIMPQLLTILKENDLDWGIITIYTCAKSCPATDAYLTEFVFKQDVSNRDEI